MLNKKSVRALDEIRRTCNEYATTGFRVRLRRRSKGQSGRLPSTRKAMRKIGYAIAYSQGSRSVAVSDLLASGALDLAFDGFDPSVLSNRTAGALRQQHWQDLGALRYKSKVDAILKAARVLQSIEREHGSFAGYLRQFGIPRRIRAFSDVDTFWVAFDELRGDLTSRKMPFFSKTTSLLQLLLDLDYDSIKPDLIVMRLSRRIGLVEKEFGDNHFREAVWSLQTYSVLRRIRPATMDLYLLTLGGQTDARSKLTSEFCPGPGTCKSTICLIGRTGLCQDFSR